jgi:hypothetical protein
VDYFKELTENHGSEKSESSEELITLVRHEDDYEVYELDRPEEDATFFND